MVAFDPRANPLRFIYLIGPPVSVALRGTIAFQHYSKQHARYDRYDWTYYLSDRFQVSHEMLALSEYSPTTMRDTYRCALGAYL